MIYIKKAVIESTDYKQFLSWIMAEWGEVDSFPDVNERGELPFPLLVFKDNEVVGGLQFSYYTDPETGVRAIWINTLYVLPAFRGHGIARMLIKQAEFVMIKTTQPELFVYTHVPKLYSEVGWETVKKNDNHSVLRILIDNL